MVKVALGILCAGVTVAIGVNVRLVGEVVLCARRVQHAICVVMDIHGAGAGLGFIAID
jgi:hypothetical protein